ncbi:uncharacterized protein [Malus domestica]|uniref:uncharacterized protein n=1 Tax=Malus domestica TaxID=3750 RepID=UPI003974F288
MYPAESPRPDEFNAGFFQHHWETMGGGVIGMIMESVQTVSYSVIINGEAMGHIESFGKYLGIQANFRVSKKKVFEDIRNKLEERINEWAEQFLLVVGKEVLLKSVATALSDYTMSCFQLPVQLAREIEQVIAHFWWRDQKTQKGIHWVA